MTWSDEDSSSNSDLDKNHLDIYVAFTANTFKISEIDLDGGFGEEFLRFTRLY